MVSRRTYITLMMLMGIIFFLFVSTGVAKDHWNDYQSNTYAGEGKITFTSGNVWKDASEKIKDGGKAPASDGKTPADSEQAGAVIYLGNPQKDAVGDTVQQWCSYTKRTLRFYESLSAWPGLKEEMPEVLLIEPDYLKEDDVLTLTELADRGVSMIFCRLPETEFISGSKRFRDLLGIQKVEADACTLDGIKLYGGFLLGEETHYIAKKKKDKERQDLDLEIPWYKLGSGTKIYMVGVFDDESDEVENEELPVIIWRAAHKDARIFAVNGAYMEDISGVGVLSAMMSELHDYELYPVVNAQNLVIINGPDLTSENEEKMQEVYSRSSRLVLRDVVFPSLVSLSIITDSPMTCMVSQGLDRTAGEASYEEMVYYLKWLREQKAEMGISLAGRGNTSFRENSEDFWDFLQKNNDTYLYSALYVPSGQLEEGIDLLCEGKNIFTGLQTITSKEPGGHRLLDYVSDTVTFQGLTGSAFSHTYAADFRLRAMETGLGYSSVYLDLERVLYPESEEDQWEKLVEKFSSNYNTYWKPFSAFEKTVLTESDRRVRQFLALDYEDGRSGNTIELNVENLKGEAYFILRTHGECIDEITGASWKKIERDAWLLTVTAPQVTITLEEETQIYYYE